MFSCVTLTTAENYTSAVTLTTTESNTSAAKIDTYLCPLQTSEAMIKNIYF